MLNLNITTFFNKKKFINYLVSSSLLLILLSHGSVLAQKVNTEYTLQQLLKSALQNNYLLQANTKSTKIKQAEIEILKNNYQPQISTSTNISSWKFLMPNKQRLLGDALTDVYTDISVRQTIYDGGENKMRKSVVEEEILLNEVISKQIQSMIVWGVSDTYFEVLKLESEVKAHINSTEQLKSQLHYAENLHMIGTVSKADILKTKVQISIEERNLQKARSAVNSQMIKLKRLCFIDSKEEIKVININDVLLNEWQNHLFIQDSIYIDVLSLHPLLLATNRKIEIEKIQKEVYRSQNKPRIFTYGVGSWEHAYIPFGDNFNYNLGVGLSYTIPFFGGSSYKTKMQQSNLLVEQMESVKDQDFNDIKKEIDITINEIWGIQIEISNNKKIINLAQETLDNELVKYQAGQGTIVDVLDVQSILTEVTIAFLKSTSAYLQAIAKLHYLSGTNINLFNY